MLQLYDARDCVKARKEAKGKKLTVERDSNILIQLWERQRKRSWADKLKGLYYIGAIKIPQLPIVVIN